MTIFITEQKGKIITTARNGQGKDRKMKKFWKKMTALALAGMLAMNGMTAFAEKTDDKIITESVQSAFILNNVQAHLSLYYGETNNKYYIGAEIPSYTVEGSKAVPYEATSYYPIYRADTLIGIFSVHTNSGGGTTLSYSEELVDHQSALDINTNYCIILNKESTYIAEANKIAGIDKNKAYTLSLANKTAIPASSAPAQDGRSNKLDVDTSWNQGTTGLCWAGTVWAIGRYIYRGRTLPFTGDPYKIADELGVDYYSGLPMSRINEAFGLYDLYAQRYEVSNKSYIIASIDAGKPIYSYWNSTGSAAHSMTLCGYTVKSSNLFVIITMDTLSRSNPGSAVIRTYSSDTSTYEEKSYGPSTFTMKSLYGVF